MPAATQAVVAAPGGDWADLLDRAGLWPVITAKGADRDVLILVNLAAGAAASAEALIDALLTRGPARIRLAASADSSALLTANRDVYALAEFAGYRYSTDAGNDYDIIDLAEETRDDAFPPGSTLHGTPASAAWIDADVRIVLGQASTEGLEGYAGALDTLIGALPRTDKDLHYRLRRDTGEVVAALLKTMPPDMALIDHRGGAGNADAPDRAFRVASATPLLADTIAASKLGLDPFGIATLAGVAAAVPLPPDYTIIGDMAPISATTPSPLTRKGRGAQVRSEAIARMAQGWALPLDAERFPFHRPLDAEAARLLSRGGAGEGVQPFLATLLGLAAQGADAWQSLFGKDMLVRRTVTLDIDPATVPSDDYDQMVAELDSMAPIALAAPERAEGLRWRKWDGATLFSFERTLPIPFDRFVAAVDVSRAISFMNDYLGGVIVACAYDDEGRPVRQAERNLYLPQPNYLALYGGKPIDVSKIEVARYAADEHRLYWKTLHSTNGSAEVDDGCVIFARVATGTRVTIIGKQLFTLPPFWQLVDVSLFPAVEEPLTTMAYHTFFDRTLNNFEALVEGRDVRIGVDPDAGTDHPSIAIEATASRLAERAAPLLERWRGRMRMAAVPAADADGFVHVVPGA